MTLFNRVGLKENVDKRIFQPKEFLSLDRAIEKAKQEVFDLIDDNNINFVEDPRTKLESFCKKITKNISIYKKIESLQELSESIILNVKM